MLQFTLLEATRVDNTVTRCLIKDDDGFYYYANTSKPVAACENLGSEELGSCLNRKGVDPACLWPACADDWREAEADAEKNTTLYIKRPRLMGGLAFLQYPDYHPGLTTREVTVCETLLKAPHPNLVAYHGVITDASDRVTGVVYTRYDSDLLEHIRSGKPFSAEHIISSVSAAVAHLHSLGLVHCDIRPPNIFVKGEGESMQVVLGDFDATYVLGEIIRAKYGSAPFWPVEYEPGMEVDFEIDDFMLKKVEEWLEYQL
ncbi:kinase-like domain-containing protein [Lophiotrema nucula]|uniref:non-specific serine/threonine protein kinase n=1 Tax=Lophiotrema nucula TaxID=690887 RepID=A0A6A5Z476_9PLEO|nr:kinase-like domain-containing protein [Lophiotrema nucula]